MVDWIFDRPVMALGGSGRVVIGVWYFRAFSTLLQKKTDPQITQILSSICEICGLI
jgi:hypothetical protein